jgi:mannan endo-1,4-beta-mannosidase
MMKNKINTFLRASFTRAAALMLCASLQSLHQPAVAQIVDNQANAEALALYDLLQKNNGVQPLTCSMAQPIWDYQTAIDVHTLTHKWPAMHCFDLMHLCYSPCDWINYGDISPVREWHQQGGAVTLMWHWQVPKQQGSTDYTSTANATDFDPSNINITDSWEHKVFYADLYEASTVLKALQDAGIAVLWRPLHEAAGNVPNGGEAWFWWGKSGAGVFKQLWQRMFSYFQEQGLHNLIWVWTSCDDDKEWFPGDEYVDIIGTDIYNKNILQVKERYEYLAKQYPSHMLALTECGQVPYLSIQWQEDCKWSWAMPWYGNDESGTPWVNDRWWKDAVKQYNPTAVNMVRADGPNANSGMSQSASAAEAFTIDGRCTTPSEHGLHIIRMSDGTTRKVLR